MAYKPDKHGRDHCPGGEDPIPCLTTAAGTFPYAIVQWTAGAQITSGDPFTPSDDWEGYVNEVGLEPAPGSSAGPVLRVTAPVGGNVDGFIRIQNDVATTRYICMSTATALWGDDPPASGQVGISNLVGQASFFGNYDVTEIADANTLLTYGSNAAHCVTALRGGIIGVPENTQEVGIEIFQTTGADLFLDSLQLEVVLLPGFPLPDAGSWEPS